MKNMTRRTWLCVAAFLPLLLTPLAWADPIVRLEAPTRVNAFQPFSTAIFVDGVVDDELLAFGLGLGFTTNLRWDGGYTVAPPFADDTPLLRGDGLVMAGSVFPGVTGDNLLLGTLIFTATEALTTAFIHVDSSGTNPSLGLFTLKARYPIDAGAYVNVPEGSSTLALILLGLGSLLCFQRSWPLRGRSTF